MKNKFILGSASPRRSMLLKQIGITPDDIIPADIDETPIKGELPRVYAERMAREKCAKLSVDHPNDYILTADTVVALGRRILPKTENANEARDCLNKLSGRRHHIYGGIALHIPNEKAMTRVVDTVVNFKRLTPTEIDTYIDGGQWNGVAGGYAIQGHAGAFVKSINGSYSNIVGLSLYDTMNMLRGSGYFNV